MDPILRSPVGPRSYEDFVPPSNWIREEGLDTILVELPGFRKENLMVQIHSNRSLRTSGERPLDRSRWHRFRTDFCLPDGCNASNIRAKFENGVLIITLPKLNPHDRPPAHTPPPRAGPSAPPAAKPEQATPTLTMPKPSKAKENLDGGDVKEAKEALNSNRKF